jgi:DNA-binding MarR family transcriptional regulator
VAAGLVDRRPSPQTRREISLSLTPAGRGRLQRYDRLRIVEARARLEAVPRDRRDSVLAALEQLVGDGAGPAPSQG